MRITVWDKSPHRASRLARLARAHLLAYPGATDSRGFTGGTRPTPATDPDDGSPLSSFILTARLRASE